MGTELAPVDNILSILDGPTGFGALVTAVGGIKDLFFNDDEEINSLVEINQALQEQNALVLQEVQTLHEEVALLSTVNVFIVLFAFSFGMFSFFSKLFGKLRLRR